MTPRATVLVPTFDNGEPIRLALASARAQTVEDIEILVVGDGTVDATRRIVAEARAEDERVRFFDNPKGPRHGEIWRDAALAGAAGDIVCYLCDDDLWFPDHVATALDLLATHDFAHTRGLRQFPDGHLETFLLDLDRDDHRRLMLRSRNRIPLSGGCHTLDAYRRLPHGWRTTPTGTNTDWYMWRQFLEQPWLTAASGRWATYVHLPNSDWTTAREAKDEALGDWAARIADGMPDDERLRLTVEAMERSWTTTDYFERRWRADLDHVLGTRWWRARAAVVGAARRAAGVISRRRRAASRP